MGFTSSLKNIFSSKDSSTASQSTRPTSQVVSKPATTQPAKPATTTTTAVAMSTATISSDQYLDAIAFRKSVYGLNDKSPISDERLYEIVAKVLKVTPSAFNSQTTRIWLLVGEEHKKFWELSVKLVKPVLDSIAGPDLWTSSFEGNYKAFAAGYGTALFFEDSEVTDEWKVKHASAAGVLDLFSEQTNAMHQINLWTALELEGFGANLQHNQGIPTVENDYKKHYNISDKWLLKAQLVFGGKAQPHPEQKEKEPTEKVLKLLK